MKNKLVLVFDIYFSLLTLSKYFSLFALFLWMKIKIERSTISYRIDVFRFCQPNRIGYCWTRALDKNYLESSGLVYRQYFRIKLNQQSGILWIVTHWACACQTFLCVSTNSFVLSRCLWWFLCLLFCSFLLKFYWEI